MDHPLDSPKTLDVTLVNAVIQSTTHVLETMTGTQATFVNAGAVTDYRPSGDISAVIGVFGDSGEGMLSISFPLPLANLLISRFLGIQNDMLSADDRSDGVGELVNMICGNTKALLARETNTLYSLTLPTVILGPEHEICSRPKNVPYLLLKFETENQAFHIQVAFKHY